MCEIRADGLVLFSYVLYYIYIYAVYNKLLLQFSGVYARVEDADSGFGGRSTGENYYYILLYSMFVYTYIIMHNNMYTLAYAIV